MPINKAIKKMNTFVGTRIWNMGESHLHNIDAFLKGKAWTSNLPLVQWSIGPDAEAVSGERRYVFHPHIKAAFINHVNQNTLGLRTLMENAALYKKNGIHGPQLLTHLEQLDQVGVQLDCRFYVRRFINLLFPNLFTAISHDGHLLKVQSALALMGQLPSNAGNTFLEQSTVVRQVITNHFNQYRNIIPANALTHSSKYIFYFPALAFHIR